MSDDESKELKAGHPPAGKYYFIFNMSILIDQKHMINKFK